MIYDGLPSSRPLTPYELSIEREILDGFSGPESERLADCLRVLSYYNLQGSTFVQRNSGDHGADEIAIESTGLVRRVADVLTGLTYSPPPARSILDDEASDKFVGEILQDNLANVLYHRADLFSTLLGVAAVEVVPATGLKPLRLYVWDYSQFVLRGAEDDATGIGHLILIDTAPDGRMRYTWWSPEFRRVYVARQHGRIALAGGRSTRLAEDSINPYGRIPAGFFHAEIPVTELVHPGVGEWLADQEAAVDQKRYTAALALKKYALPKPYVGGASAEWQPTDVAGEFMRIPAEMLAQGSSQPNIGFLQAQLNLDAIDAHVDRSIERVLEARGVPLSIYRMDQSSVASGDALQAERQPLIDYSRARQESLKLFEGDVVEAVLAVGGVYLRRPELTAAGRGGANLTVSWPEDLVSVPGADQDTQDQTAMALGLQSLVDVTRRRFRLSSDEEAVRRLLKVQQDNAKLAALGVLPATAQEDGRNSGSGAVS